jgi:hypothetical protein
MAQRSGSPRVAGETAIMAARVLGAVFLAIGILGFIPGITTNYDEMELAGPDSNAKLLGIFTVSVLHNIVHLLFGVAGLIMGRTFAGARAFLLGGGVIYAVLWLYGLLVDRSSDANFVPFDDADDWLHLVLAIVMIGLGVAFSRTPARR